MFEHAVYNQIFKHLTAHNILTSDKHGFKKHYSCNSKLLSTIEDFSLNFDSGAQIDAIFLDFSKAFDKVPHECQFLKLSHYGVQGTLLDWIRDFLMNRTQQVVLNNIISESANVVSGVSQGSVLGPLLFLLYHVVW